jgi:hypothetical protein
MHKKRRLNRRRGGGSCCCLVPTGMDLPCRTRLAFDAACDEPFERLFAAAPALAIGDDPRILHEGADRAPPATAESGDHLHGWYDICRRGRHRIAARLLLGALNASEAAHACSNLADAALTDIMRVCAADFVARHGRVRKGRHAVVAIGRLGARA